MGDSCGVHLSGAVATVVAQSKAPFFGEILSVVEGCGFLLKLSCTYFSCLEFKTRDGNFKVVWIVHPDFLGMMIQFDYRT